MNTTTDTGTTGAASEVAVGPQSWQETLPTLLALLTCGTAAGKAIAKRELLRMAAAADLSGAALSALGEFASVNDQPLPASVEAVLTSAGCPAPEAEPSTKRGHQ